MDNKKFKTTLISLPRSGKRLLMLSSDAIILGTSFWLACALHFDALIPTYSANFAWVFFLLPLLSLPAFYFFGLFDSVIRYQGAQVVYSIAKGVTAAAVWVICLLWLTAPTQLTTEIVVLFWLLALVSIGGSRFLTRAYLHTGNGKSSSGKTVIIYGAGVAGHQAALSLINGPEYRPVAFVDDDPALQKNLIQGIRVYSSEALESLVERFAVDTILLAMPAVSRSKRKAIIAQIDTLPVSVKTLPGMAELVSGAARLDELREVQIEDLLGREPVAPNKKLLSNCIIDKVVMVTGAGGSIGSELARQIAYVKPKKLVLFEVSEWALYEIERDLRRLCNGELEIVSILGNVTNLQLLTQTMSEFEVQTVYHAAAYKHVPLVEHNLLGGIHNNVIGTWRAVEAACAARVETFVLVSTDKAVRPTNVMGASKRCAELVLQGVNQRLVAQGHNRPVVSMVRFGNVLGSSGSVVPLFREQIKAGGPITVTHPDIIRYFMTAPEAANLVIQAGAMAGGGEVFVLDMGEPVRIVDLARRMIRLAGQEVYDAENPSGEIAIEFSGLRPGEKLYEELLIGEGAAGTQHRKILQANERCMQWEELLPKLESLQQACRDFNCESGKKLLMELVGEYTPADEIYDHLWSTRSNRLKAKLAHPEVPGSSQLQ